VDSFPKPRTTKNRLILKQALQIAGLLYGKRNARQCSLGFLLL